MTVTAAQATSPGGRVERTPAPAAPSQPASPGFAETLASAARTGATAPHEAAGAGRAVHQHSRSGELEPIQQFESFVLRSFIENMMPNEESAFFGTGTAGKIWRSMLAERMADEMAASGGVGIAAMLEKQDAVPASGGEAARP